MARPFQQVTKSPSKSEGLIFYISLINSSVRDKICLSLSDPTVVVLGKGVIMMLKIILEALKRIVESVVARSIYDWLKHLFEDDD